MAGSTAEQKWSRACATTSFLLVITAAILLICLGLLFLSPSPEITTAVRYSTEYQAVIFPDDWNTSEKRKTMLAAYLSKVNQAMGSEIAINDGATNIRSQFYYTMNGGHRCGSDYDIRVREYLEGPSAGTRYMDMKAGSHIEYFACTNPIWPAEGSPMGLLQAGKSTLKCERDVHACDGKYSMSSRVFFEESLAELPMLSTCNDVRLFYPWSLPDTTEEQRFHPVTENMKVHFWWVWSYQGTLPSHDDGEATTINIDATLEYDTLEDARSGEMEPGHSSEFSMKIFERTNGYAAAVQSSAQAMHRSILDTYGSRGQYEGGVCL